MIPFFKTALLAAFLVTARGHAALTDEDVRDQCRRLASQLDAWRANADHQGMVQLVLGARTQEIARFSTSALPPLLAPKWIFLSVEAHDPSAEFHVQCDFNRATHLGHLAGALAGKVDAILFDQSVVKFTEWTRIHYTFIRKLLKPNGTLFLPLESWGCLALGVDPAKGHTPLDAERPTQDLAYDSRRLGRIIHLAMLKGEEAAEKMHSGAPPWLPGMLHVPLNWPTLDAATRAGALEFWKTTYLVPGLEGMLKGEGGFTTVTRVKFTPTFLKGDPSAVKGVDVLACRP